MTRWLLLLGICLSSVFLLFSLPGRVEAQSPQATVSEWEVTSIIESGDERGPGGLVPFQKLELGTKSGDSTQTIVVINGGAADNPQAFQAYQVGDRLRVEKTVLSDGSSTYGILGQSRRAALLALFGLFVASVLVVGRKWGVLSFLGLIASFLVLSQLVIPLILQGYNPVFAAIIGSCLIIPITFYVSHGWNKKTHVGVLATIIGLTFTGLMGAVFISATHLTGFASEEAAFVSIERQGSIDIRGLLLAGIIIGTLGIMDDITISQASVVQQLKRTNSSLNRKQLFKQAMGVGQDHISSMVNTLVLVYAGAALPLLLLFYGQNSSIGAIVEYEFITEEIVRMLVGSIGLVLIAPLATALAAMVFGSSQHE